MTGFITTGQILRDFMAIPSDALIIESIGYSETFSTDYYPIKMIGVPHTTAGFYLRISYTLLMNEASGTVHGQLYINGVASGLIDTTSSNEFTTYTHDLYVPSGGLVELRAKTDDTSYGALSDNLSLKGDVSRVSPDQMGFAYL